ncbi:type I methionyl aminopeptidase [Candidatus Saccharibacteria bacterium]|nr:type I methionyl aminopeptidase [Candidatus Saccharibacteria bacterium]
MRTRIKTPEEIIHMRQSGKILAEILQILKKATVAGITTAAIDAIAVAELDSRGAQAAFLGYQDFPASICISVNDEIVHGIPSDKIIQEGDLVGLDFGVNYKGMITDSAITVPVGKINKNAQRLLDYTQRALDAGVGVLKDGVRVGDIGAAIEEQLILGDLKVIETLGGHGVGHVLNEEPYIANFGTKGTGDVLKAGMTIALEPIASLGTHDTDLASDNWTYVTSDNSLSAQFEHTVLITQDGAEILTQI